MSVEINDDQDVPLDLSRLQSRLQEALEKTGCANAELSVLLTDDRRMADLNRTYRGVDGPTDVLSFPQNDTSESVDLDLMGDIVISIPTAALQARESGISLDVEVEHLALHGFLHLLGHDHETDGWEDWDRALAELCQDG
jgi:probable rRNA maturation factor